MRARVPPIIASRLSGIDLDQSSQSPGASPLNLAKLPDLLRKG
jgi:hypothetical protein